MISTTDSSKKELNHNIQKFQRETRKFDGEKWTKGQAINKIFITDYKKYNVDSLQYLNQKYKDAERLRIAARSAAEIFQDLKALSEDDSGGEEAFFSIMEKARRLSVYAFASSKTIDNEARTVATKALKLPETLISLGEEDEDDDKELAFSAEVVQQIQKARYEDQVIRGSQNNRGNSRGGYNHGGFRGHQG